MTTAAPAMSEDIPARVWLQATRPITEWDLSDPRLQEAFEQVIRATYQATHSSPDRATGGSAR